ncbi:DUF5343 domain-containing protein [Nostoc sp.]
MTNEAVTPTPEIPGFNSNNGANATEVNREKPNGVEKKPRNSLNYLPYVNAYGSIPTLFSKIQEAAVPKKFTQDFMSSMLGMSSSSHRAFPGLLKKLGFLDQGNVPTEVYRQYRDPWQSKRIMAQQLRIAYSDLYRANEFAHKINKDKLIAKLKALTGAGDDDTIISTVASTFIELRNLASFDEEQDIIGTSVSPKKSEPENVELPHSRKARQASLGVSYMINLNLPATTDIEVFNAIFKSLKEHILYED